MSSDISNEMHAQTDTLDPDVAFRSMADYAPVLIWTSDVQKNGVYFNKPWLDYTGRTLAEELGEGWLDRVHPDDLESRLKPCAEAFARKQPFQTQFRLRRHDGVYRWFLDTGVPRFLPGGEFAGYIGSCVDITERVEAEQALQERELEARKIADAVPMLISYVDTDLRYQFNNHTYEEWFGASREELRGRRLVDVLGEAAYRSVEPYIHKVLQGDKVHYERWVDYKSRGLACIHCNYVPDFDSDGKVRGFYATIIDITNERLAQDALERNEERLRLALTAGQLGDWELEIASGEMHLSRRVLEIFDLQKTTLPLSGFLEVVHPDEKQRVESALHEAIRSKTDYNIEHKILWRDGSTRWVCVRGRAFYSDDDKPLRMAGVALDVTEHRRATEAITEAARKLSEEREIVDTLYHLGRTVAAELELDKIVQVVTDEATRLSGAQFGAFFYNQRNEKGEIYSLYTLSGVPLDHFEGREMPRVTEVFGPTFRGEGVVRSPNILEDPRYGKTPPHFGLPQWHVPVVSYLAVPVVSRSGEVLGGLFFAHSEPDMFDERDERIVIGIASHAAVALDNARLYKEAQNVGSKLLQRSDELESVVQELEAFSYSVSHDLRSPLRAIDAFSNIIENDHAENLPEEGKRYLRLVRENSEKMNTLITDLLAFSKLSRQSMHKQPVDLEGLARQVMEELAVLYPATKLEVIYSRLPMCRGDASLLRQVLMNLLSNALKYSSKKERMLIEVGSTTTPQGETAIYVRDNGVGFNMKYIDKLFKVFQRLHRSDDYEGTGVGLAIVHRIITRHGGRVWAEANSGEGATFYFTLGPDSCQENPA